MVKESSLETPKPTGTCTAGTKPFPSSCILNSDCGLNGECSTCPIGGEDPTCVNYYGSGCTTSVDCSGEQGSSIGENKCYTWNQADISTIKPTTVESITGHIGGTFATTTPPVDCSTDGVVNKAIMIDNNNMSALQGGCINDCTSWWVPTASSTACDPGPNCDPNKPYDASKNPCPAQCRGCTSIKCPSNTACFCNSTLVCQGGKNPGADCTTDSSICEGGTCSAIPSICTDSHPAFVKKTAWPGPDLTGSPTADGASYPVWAQVFYPDDNQQCPLNFIQCSKTSDCPQYWDVDGEKVSSTCDGTYCMATPARSVQNTQFCPVNFRVDYGQTPVELPNSKSNSLNTSFMGGALGSQASQGGTPGSPSAWSNTAPVPPLCKGTDLACAGLDPSQKEGCPEKNEAEYDNCGGGMSGTSLSFPFIAGKAGWVSPKTSATTGGTTAAANMWSCAGVQTQNTPNQANNYIGCGQKYSYGYPAGPIPTFDSGVNPLFHNEWSAMNIAKWNLSTGEPTAGAGALCLTQALDHIADTHQGLQLNSAEWSQTCADGTPCEKASTCQDGKCGVCIAEYSQASGGNEYCDVSSDAGCFNQWHTSASAKSTISSPLYCPVPSTSDTTSGQNMPMIPGKLSFVKGDGNTPPTQNQDTGYVYMCNSQWPQGV